MAAIVIRERILEPFGDDLIPEVDRRQEIVDILGDPNRLSNAEITRIASDISSRLNRLSGLNRKNEKVSRTVFWVAVLPWIVFGFAVLVYLFHGQRLSNLSAQLFYVDESGYIGEPALVSFKIPTDNEWHRITIGLPGKDLLRVRFDPAARGGYFEYVEFRNATLRVGDSDKRNPVTIWHATNTNLTRSDDTFTLTADSDGPSILSEITYTEDASEFEFEVRAKAERISLLAWIWRWPS